MMQVSLHKVLTASDRDGWKEGDLTYQKLTLMRTISCLRSFGAADFALAANLTGCCKDKLAKSFTSSVMVALKSIVCRLRGANLRISWICSRAQTIHTMCRNKKFAGLFIRPPDKRV